ncbi:MAG: hypothetical protein ACFNZS_06935 [Ottowia sp.]
MRIELGLDLEASVHGAPFGKTARDFRNTRMAPLTGANSGLPKTRSALSALGHHAIDKVAKNSGLLDALLRYILVVAPWRGAGWAAS